MPKIITRYKTRFISLLSLLLLAGCNASLPTLRQEAKAPEPIPAAIQATSSRTKPDAVYTLESGSQTLPPSVNQSLQDIAAQVKANRNVVIRLESYVPGGGSREMNVSLSTSAVERVRRRLIELGVPSYRIKRAPLGEEHPDARKVDTTLVELFLVPLPR